MTTASNPSPTQLYELLVRLHDDVRQIQYPYSAKVLKWGIIQESEIEEALKSNVGASEQTVWEGKKPAIVAQGLAGGFTRFVDQDGYREKWKSAGLAEGSWRVFLEQYCMLKADPVPFNSKDYLRGPEMDNLLTLVRILDEQIFSSPAMKGPTNLKACFKTKWWKECHKVFSEAVMEAVYRQLGLPERPKYGLCHTREWTNRLKTEIAEIAGRWTTCPVWDRPQSSDPAKGVDFTSNNEKRVKEFLTANSFTTHYLEGR